MANAIKRDEMANVMNENQIKQNLWQIIANGSWERWISVT